MEPIEIDIQNILTGAHNLDAWCHRALELLDEVYKVSQVGDMELQQITDERVKQFLKENGRTV